MILEKIQHHLGLSFLVVLVFAQSLFFLGVRASVSHNYDLQALYVSPIVPASIEKGEIVNFEAYLYVPGEVSDIDWAFFEIKDLDSGLTINIDASPNNDLWISDIPWDTSIWPLGDYELSVTAYHYDADGIVNGSYTSEVKDLRLIESIEYQAAQIVPEEYSDFIHITQPYSGQYIPIGTDMEVIVDTEQDLNLFEGMIQLEIFDTFYDEPYFIASSTIYQYNENEDYRSWEGYIDTGALVEDRTYELRANFFSIGGSNSVGALVSTSTPFVTGVTSEVDYDIFSYVPQSGSVINGEQTIRLQFEPALPANREIIARVGHENDLSFSYDLGTVEIDSSRHIAEIVWDTAMTEGDFADPVFPDSDLANQNNYYQVNFYSREIGSSTEELFAVSLYKLDNEHEVSSYPIAPGPLSERVYLNFSFSDPYLVYAFGDDDREYHNLRARVTTALDEPNDFYDLENVVSNPNHTNISAEWNTLAESPDGQPLFPNSGAESRSEYWLQIWDQVSDEGPDPDTNLIYQQVYEVQNDIETEGFVVTWDEPIGGPYSNNQIILQANTSLPAEYLNFEITKNGDETIGSGVISGVSLDNQNWNALFVIPNDWSDGEYTIHMSAMPNDPEYGTDEITAIHSVTIALQGSNEEMGQGQARLNLDLGYYNLEALNIETQGWTYDELQRLTASFIISDINGNESAIINGNNVIPDYDTGKFLAVLNNIDLDNGVYVACGYIHYNGMELLSTCSDQFEIAILAEEDEDNTDGFVVEFLQPIFDEDLNETKFYAVVEDLGNAKFVLRHIESGEDFYLGAIYDNNNNRYVSNINMPDGAFYGLPSGNYEIYLQIIGSGEFSNKSPHSFVIEEIQENSVNIIESDLEIHLEDGDTLHTGQNIIISSNYYKASKGIDLAIKMKDNGTGIYNISASVIDCQHDSVSEAVKNSINEINHSHCWLAHLPAEGGLEEEEDRVFNNSLYLSTGKGSLMASYSFEDEDNNFLSARSVKNNINFIFTAKHRAEAAEHQEVIEEPIKADSTSFDDSEINCLALRIFDDQDCAHFKALISDNIDSQCLSAGIYTEDECENYLLQKKVKLECDSEEIVDPVACQDWLLEKYTSTVECQLGDLNLCTSLLRDRYLNRLVVAKKQQDRISSSTKDIIGKIVTLDELRQTLKRGEVDPEILPLQANKDIKVLLAKSKDQTVLETEDQLTVLHSAVMIVDSDADGLADDLESYYDTDPNNPDTDGDGYLDGEEINNGYNPNGEGRLVKELSNLEQIIFSDSNIEQPKKYSDKIDKDIEINLTEAEGNKIRLQGKSAADTWINIFVYSDLPLVMTTKTDASGNWTYDLKHSLVDGGHKVYVTVNDDTGSIVKQSSPLAFLVKSAQAVSADQYFDTDEAAIESVTDSMLWLYILGAGILIVFGIVFIFILHRQKNFQK